MRVLSRLLRARSVLALGVLTSAALLLPASSAFAGLIAPDPGQSPNADAIRQLYLIVFGLGMVIFFGVGGLLLFTMRKYRARKGAVAAQIHGNTRLEIGWTLGAALLLVLIAVVTFVKLDAIENPPNSGPGGLPVTKNGSFVASGATQQLPPNGRTLAIEVNGQQYIWRYTYEDGDKINLNNVFAYEQMVVPTNTTVTLSIRAQDVQHSWWIPQLGGKFDAVPGYTNFTWFKISKPGTYRGQCAELCGRNHANMIASVKAVTPTQFEAWYAAQKAAIGAADTQAAAGRRALLAADAASVARGKAQNAAGGATGTTAAPSAATQLAEAKKLFVAGNPSTGALACGACHTLKDAGTAGQTGPNLDKVLSTMSAADINTSITDPNAKIATGFPKNVMPQDYAQTLTKAQVDALVAYIFKSTHGK